VKFDIEGFHEIPWGHLFYFSFITADVPSKHVPGGTEESYENIRMRVVGVPAEN